MYYSLKAYWVTVQCEHIADSFNLSTEIVLKKFY